MTTPSLLLRCGCTVRYDDGTVPECAAHGRQAVSRTLHMPTPRIRGVATGPLVQTMDLDPFMGRLAGSDAKES